MAEVAHPTDEEIRHDAMDTLSRGYALAVMDVEKHGLEWAKVEAAKMWLRSYVRQA